MSSSALAPSSVTVRDPKATQFLSIVEGAYNKAGLSKEEAQRVNETTGLADLVTQFIEKNRYSDRFQREEVGSNYGYLSGYKKPGFVD